MDEYDQSVIFADDNGAPLGGETGESVSPDRDDIAEQNTAADSGENADRQDAAAEDTAPEAEAETDRYGLPYCAWCLPWRCWYPACPPRHGPPPRYAPA